MALRALTQETIDFVERAPVRVTGRATTTASAATVFEILADHERWSEWFPGVKRIEVLGPAEGVGARRRVRIPGATVEERFIVWEPGERWSFTGTAATPGFMNRLVEDCRLTGRDGGGTEISYTMAFEPALPFRLLVGIARSALTKNLDKAMAALAARAEAREPDRT